MGNLNVQARDSVSQTTKQNGKQQVKEYSKDGKLWVGMTQKEAYLDDELSKLFSHVDVNNDRVLDKDEIARYNGPTLVTCDKGTYYPGLQLENVSPESQEVFREIDSAPRDGILQENELQEYGDKLKKSESKGKLLSKLLMGAFSIPLGLGMGAVFSGIITDALLDIKGTPKGKAVSIIIKALSIGWALLAGNVFVEDCYKNGDKVVTHK